MPGGIEIQAPGPTACLAVEHDGRGAVEDLDDRRLGRRVLAELLAGVEREHDQAQALILVDRPV